jgi:hypothetical protein
MRSSSNNDLSTINSTTYIVHDLSESDIDSARLTVASYSRDADEARMFLDALGLNDPKVRSHG